LHWFIDYIDDISDRYTSIIYLRHARVWHARDVPGEETSVQATSASPFDSTLTLRW
jgi:hypothetical protein